MDQTLSTVALLTAALVAFFAVGCVSPARSAEPTSAAVATTAATPLPAATVTLAQVARAPAAQLALTPQPAPQSGQVQISGQGFSAGESGDESGASSTATFKVLEPKPWLELTAWSGAPGAPVGFGGGGWIGGEPVDIHIGSATNPVQAVAGADDNGWLKVTNQVYVPLDAADELIFVAVGERSHLAAAATFRIVLPFGLRPAKTPVPGVNTGG